MAEEVGTQRAADILGVSKTNVAKMLRRAGIKSRTEGSYSRWPLAAIEELRRARAADEREQQRVARIRAAKANGRRGS